MKITFFWLTLRRFNHLLTAVVVMFALYIVVAPVLPALQWWIHHSAPVVSRSHTALRPPEQIPKDNTLIIPALDMQEVIHEGPTKATLHYGVWHRPQTSTPDKGGNTVLAGHRYTYSDPAVFYNLDKVAVHDAVVLYWNGVRYNYKITSIQTVTPDKVSIEDPTPDARVTIYTCTPLWSSSHRLVITAKLMDKS